MIGEDARHLVVGTPVECLSKLNSKTIHPLGEIFFTRSAGNLQPGVKTAALTRTVDSRLE